MNNLLDCVADVRDDVGGERLQRKPANLTAFIGFTILWLTSPDRRCEEEGNTFIGAAPVNHMAHAKSLGLYVQACFLHGFPGHGLSGSFAAINVTGNHTVVSVFVARVVPPKQQDTIFTKEE